MKVHPNTPNSRQIKGESYKEIDQLRIGDLVLSGDEHTGELSYHPVTELFVHDVKLIHRLTYKEGLTVETTWNHPFWVQDKGWTEAKDLHAGERSVTAMSILKAKQPRLQTVSFTSKVQPGFDDPSMLTWDDAREGTLSVARVEEVHRADKVYNIEVEGNHTYFVTEEGVLVHNYQYGSGSVENGDNFQRIADGINKREGRTGDRAYTAKDIRIMNGYRDENELAEGQHVHSKESFGKLSIDQKKTFIYEKVGGQETEVYGLGSGFAAIITGDGQVGYYRTVTNRGLFTEGEEGLYYFVGIGAAVDISVTPLRIYAGGAKRNMDQYLGNDPDTNSYFTTEVCAGEVIVACGGLIHDSSGKHVEYSGGEFSFGVLPVSIGVSKNKTSGSETETEQDRRAAKTVPVPTLTSGKPIPLSTTYGSRVSCRPGVKPRPYCD